MRERAGGQALVTAALLVIAVAAVAVVEMRRGEPFGHSRHDDTEWVQVLSEEFDSELDPGVWNRCHWWDDGGCTIASNNEMQWYLPGQVSVSDGSLRLTASAEPVKAPNGITYPYRSGMVTTGPPDSDGESRFEFLYGRAEARVRAPAGDGLWSAFWLLPSTTESRPEIDILELLGNDPSELLFHFHPLDRDQTSPGSSYRGPDLSVGWHDVGIDWEPGRIRWFVDGEQVWSIEGDDVPDEPMYLVLNLAVGGVYPGPPGEDTPFPSTFAIDRVTVWQRQS